MKDNYNKSITVRITSSDFDFLKKLKSWHGINPSIVLRNAILKHRVELNNLSDYRDEK